ncbi:MAG: undecaprenyl-diphosphate phosphatase [Eubacterium sp.]|nr:undecaprenyl-diphosphate phosphatase [Eubacterium sp.]
MESIQILELFKAVLFGIVEGITEWLPISSTGHMILLNEFIKLNVSEAFWSMFEVVIQLGAILAVVVVFWHNIWPFGRRNNPQPLAKNGPLSFVKKDIIKLWIKIIIACIPAAVIGMAFNDTFEALFYNFQTVAIFLIIFGIAFIVIENKYEGKTARVATVEDLTWKLCLIIGLFQLIAAIFPGTSRSGATIVGALLIGVSRVAAAEFTFYLAIPVMFGASLLKLAKFGLDFTPNEVAILIVGMVVAFIVSIIVIKFLMSYIKKHDFKVFGWYRIVLGILVLVYFGVKTLVLG